MKACFMGLGYIGLPTAIIAAEHGVEIAGVDINDKVVSDKLTVAQRKATAKSTKLSKLKFSFKTVNDDNII